VRHLALALPILLLSVACAVPQVPATKRLEPITVPEGVETSELALRRIVPKIAPNEGVLHVQNGFLCLPGTNHTLPPDRLPASRTDLDRGFRSTFGPLRYKLQKEPDSVFVPEGTAELQLGATITKLHANLCFPFSAGPLSDPSRVKGKVFVEIIWELYSLSERRVIYTSTVPGSFDNAESVEGGFRTMFLNAFNASLTNLAADPVFSDLASKHRPRLR
jgi:hypothetical protein